MVDIAIKKDDEITKRIIADIAKLAPELPAEPQGGFALPESQVKAIPEPAEAESESEQVNP
jgi:hypothetical protein